MRRSYRSSRIANDRAEILDLIDKLSAEKRAPVRRRTQRRPRSSNPPAVGRLIPPRPPIIEPADPFVASGGIATLLRSLEVRIGLLEDRMQRTERRTSRPAPPVSGQHVIDLTAHTFSGVIQGQMLSDMLQLVSSNNMSGRFVVQDEGSSCKLFFDEGRICHAEAGRLSGENAFFAAFAFASGRYYFQETTELPAERTINSSTQFLILEALRKIDESTA